MRKFLLALLTVLVAASPALAQQGTLEIAVDQGPVGLDPHLVTAFSSFVVIGQIYDGLVEFDADLKVGPALATSWEVSDDNLVYDLQLRDDVVFHDGSEMTADDVVYSFERIMAEETGSPQASRFSQVESVEATGEHAVRFTLAAPFAPFLGNLSNLAVVPREVVEAEGDLQRVAVGTGPFMLDEVVPDTYVRLVANPNYSETDSRSSQGSASTSCPRPPPARPGCAPAATTCCPTSTPPPPRRSRAPPASSCSKCRTSPTRSWA